MASRRIALGVALAATAALVVTLAASANVAVTIIATDPFTNSTSQHKTIVEPDTYSFGSTIVAAAQWGRFFDGGASDIGVSVSTNNGTSWTAQALPALTAFSNPPGPYARVSDPSVAYDVKHKVWMVSSLALDASVRGAAVIVSRSTDGGGMWQKPQKVRAASGTEDFDKSWIVCDSSAISQFHGNCYIAWDDFGNGNALMIAYSRDGGLTWTMSTTPNVDTIGVQPLVQPKGKIVVPLDNASETALGAVVSNNGGVSFVNVSTITSITAAADPGNIRSGPLPSAEISGDGKIYVVWEDCRFRALCSTNDLVYTTSMTGTTWTPVERIPIDAVNSNVDHFIPGIAVDKNTSGANIHLAVGYYFYPSVNCMPATCQLDVGYISSPDGGSTWTAPWQLRGPMTTSWLANTTQGRMVGDYISTSYDGNGLAHPVFAEGYAPPTGDCATSTPNCNQPLETPSSGLGAAAAVTAQPNDPVLFTAKPQPGKSAFKHRH
jgi:BNR repeat protein